MEMSGNEVKNTDGGGGAKTSKRESAERLRQTDPASKIITLGMSYIILFTLYGARVPE
jgi:hypothetical protein